MTSIDATREAALAGLNVPGSHQERQRPEVLAQARRRASSRRIEELDGSILAGTPDDIVAGVQRYQELGADLLIFDFRMRFPDWLEQIETLARDVFPRVASAPVGAAS